MNSEEKATNWGKQREGRKANQFLWRETATTDGGVLYPLVPLLSPFGSRPREMGALDVEAM
jgi:hypothetical protein